jgi:hypothetical protein
LEIEIDKRGEDKPITLSEGWKKIGRSLVELK